MSQHLSLASTANSLPLQTSASAGQPRGFISILSEMIRGGVPGSVELCICERSMRCMSEFGFSIGVLRMPIAPSFAWSKRVGDPSSRCAVSLVQRHFDVRLNVANISSFVDSSATSHQYYDRSLVVVMRGHAIALHSDALRILTLYDGPFVGETCSFSLLLM
jgi:hypothetical protein